MHQDGTTVVVNCTGDIDIATAPELQRCIDRALALHPTALVVDLTQVVFFASHGMRILVETQNALTTGRLVVVADGPVTLRPMHIVGLDELLDFAPTLADASARLAV